MLIKKSDDDTSYWYSILYQLLLDNDYQFRARVLRASDYGDPQARDRVIIIAAKRGRVLPRFPSPTHGTGANPHVTVHDALESLELIAPDAEDGSGMVMLPDGTITQDHCTGTLKADSTKLNANKPSITIRRTNGIKHYSLERCITVREMARLQSFPDDYQFCGSATQKKSQIGNAVPCKLASAIAKGIREGSYFC